MTFEEFKELALNPPYADHKSVYRIDVHRYGFTYGEFHFRKMMCAQTLMCLDWQSVQCVLKQFRSKRHLRILLYAVYVYRLPVDMNIADNSYQQLCVYDRFNPTDSHGTYQGITQFGRQPVINSHNNVEKYK